MIQLTASIDRSIVARESARIFLEIGAVHANATTPFKLTSGRTSPVYVDCRKIISHPRARTALMELAVATLTRDIGYEQIEVVAGGETAGIPFAAWIADRLSLPMQYVRKTPKGFGRNARVEGEVFPGARTLLVEDLATDGHTKVSFCSALREAGAKVDHCFVLFYYDVFDKSKDNIKKSGITLHHLVTWQDILDVAKRNEYFDVASKIELESFLNSPEEWSLAHGGAIIA